MISLIKNLILKYVNVYHKIKISELVKITKCSKSYICKCVRELEEDGLIKKYYNKSEINYQL